MKLYDKCPENGLVVYCGMAQTDEGKKDKQTALHFEPRRPARYLYRCDNRFHVDDLKTLMADESEDPFGFIIVDGNGALFGKVQGTTREVLRSFTVDLPNKHGRGGQSAKRFERIRREKRDVYLRRVAELLTYLFISKESSRPNVNS